MIYSDCIHAASAVSAHSANASVSAGAPSGKRIATAVLALALLSGASPALAADYYGSSPVDSRSFAPYNEVRGGVYFHDTMDRESGVDINAEILMRWGALAFKTPFLDTQSMLRPHIGGNLNTSGDTSILYAGYTLSIDLTDYLFVEGSFGGMVHNGNTEAGQGGLALGCNVMFHESASVGYRINQAWNLSAIIEHSSNNGYCSDNDGLTNVGVRLGYAF